MYFLDVDALQDEIISRAKRYDINVELNDPAKAMILPCIGIMFSNVNILHDDVSVSVDKIKIYLKPISLINRTIEVNKIIFFDSKVSIPFFNKKTSSYFFNALNFLKYNNFVNGNLLIMKSYCFEAYNCKIDNLGGNHLSIVSLKAKLPRYFYNGFISFYGKFKFGNFSGFLDLNTNLDGSNHFYLYNMNGNLNLSNLYLNQKLFASTVLVDFIKHDEKTIFNIGGKALDGKLLGGMEMNYLQNGSYNLILDLSNKNFYPVNFINNHALDLNNSSIDASISANLEKNHWIYFFSNFSGKIEFFINKYRKSKYSKYEFLDYLGLSNFFHDLDGYQNLEDDYYELKYGFNMDFFNQ